MIVGITHDPSFGPLVLFGLGGVDRGAARRPCAAARAGHRRGRRTSSSARCAARSCSSATAGSPRSTSARSRICSCASARSPTSSRDREMDLNPVVVSERRCGRDRRQDPRPAGRGAAARRPPPPPGLSRRSNDRSGQRDEDLFPPPGPRDRTCVHALRPARVPRLPDPGIRRFAVLRVRACRCPAALRTSPALVPRHERQPVGDPGDRVRHDHRLPRHQLAGQELRRPG